MARGGPGRAPTGGANRDGSQLLPRHPPGFGRTSGPPDCDSRLPDPAGGGSDSGGEPGLELVTDTVRALRLVPLRASPARDVTGYALRTADLAPCQHLSTESHICPADSRPKGCEAMCDGGEAPTSAPTPAPTAACFRVVTGWVGAPIRQLRPAATVPCLCLHPARGDRPPRPSSRAPVRRAREQPPLQHRLPGGLSAERGTLLPGPGYTTAYIPRHPSREPGSGSDRPPLAAAGSTASRPQDRSHRRRRTSPPRTIAMEPEAAGAAASPGPRTGWRADDDTAAHGPPPGSGSRDHCRRLHPLCSAAGTARSAAKVQGGAPTEGKDDPAGSSRALRSL